MKHLLLTLFCALCCTTLAPASERNFRRELSRAESTEEIQAILATDEWQQLTHEEQIEQLGDLCQCTHEAAAIEAILATGFRLNPPQGEEYGVSPLAELYSNEHLNTEEMISLSTKLLEAGAVMDEAAFWMSCRSFKKELISFCLAKGAQVDEGMTWASPLTCLCLYTPNYLINKLDDDASEAERAAAEVKQIELNQRRKECILYLIEQGANINGKGEESPTPLNSASLAGNIEIMTILLEHGADVNATPSYGISPLHDATSCFSNLAAVKLLVQHGADIHQRTPDKVTPLMTACLSGQADVVRYLLEQGADPHAWSNSIGLEDEYPSEFIDDFNLPCKPTLAFCFIPYIGTESISWESAWLIFKSLNCLSQLAYVLIALILIALPFLVLGLIIWLICRLIRFIKRKK